MNITVQPSSIKKNKSINICGHKHSFVQIISAAIILNRKCHIDNVPKTDDAIIFLQLIKQLGGIATFKNNRFYIDPTNMKILRPNMRLCKKIHGSMYFLFALGIRFGKFYIIPTGGCKIGKNNSRPVSHLLKIFSQFGKITKIKNDEYAFNGHSNKNIKQNIMAFSDSLWFLSGEQISSATKLCILAAIGNKSNSTTIKNYYFRTDVSDLLSFVDLTEINVSRTKNKIRISSSTLPTNNGLHYTLSDCQSEIITFIAFAVMHNIKLNLKIKSPQKTYYILKPELVALKNMGVDIRFTNNVISICKPSSLNPLNLHIKHNGIQSDHQPFFALMLSQATGESLITEHVWKNRFKYAEELNKIGFNIQKYQNKILIVPTKTPHATAVIASDTRAAAVLLIAATTLQQKTRIYNAEHLMRGYDTFIEKVQQLGATII